MGVVRNPFGVQPTNDDNGSSADEFIIVPSEPSTAASSERDDLSVVDSIAARRERRRLRVARRHKEPRLTDQDRDLKRNVGTKKHRRIANDLMLMNQADANDLECITIEDFIPSHVNPLGRIFLEKKCMMAWNRFMMAPEEDQRRFLEKKKGADEKAEKLTEKKAESVKLSESWDSLSDALEACDVRDIHPAGGEDQDKLGSDDREPKTWLKGSKEPRGGSYFARVDHHLRTLLQRKHTPLGAISFLENEICEFFTQNPTSVFIYRLQSSYLRLLFHSCCQYMGLSSSSYEEGGHRWTHVSNPLSTFCPPPVRLHMYLDEIRCTKG